MHSQSEAFDKAAECERLMSLTSDEVQRLAYQLLRLFWIGLANESASWTSPEELARDFAYLDLIQTNLQHTKQR